jgi:hypothetical protein
VRLLLIFPLVRGGEKKKKKGNSSSMAMEVDQVDDLMLEPQDCVLGNRARTDYQEHPGNKTFESLLEKHLSSYGLAATADERNNIVARLEAQARATPEHPLRFLIPKEGSSSNATFREATSEEITAQLHALILAKFTVKPADDDVLVYTGESVRKQSHIGNQRLHAFIRSLGRIFPLAHQRRGLVNVPHEVVTLRGSKFLIPLDPNQPSQGCVQADDESITPMLAKLLE